MRAEKMRKTDMDGPIGYSSLTLEHEEQIINKIIRATNGPGQLRK
jgi:hypothetical protein